MSDKPSIFLQKKDTLKDFILANGEAKFRVDQLSKWLFEKKAYELDQMKNLFMTDFIPCWNRF